MAKTSNRQIAQALNQMKAEVSTELGIQTGPDQTARMNGSVGGAMTKRLIQLAEASLINQK